MRRSERIRRRNLVLAARSAHGNLQSNEGILEVAQLLWKTLDTPLSLGLSLLASNGQLEDLLKVKFQPSRYLEREVRHASDDYQAISFLRKMPLVLPGVSRADSAARLFREAEDDCRRTNARLRGCRDRGDYPLGVGAVLYYAQRKISRVLGHLDARSWALRCRFGPGADHLAKGGRVSPYNKLERVGSTFDFASGALDLAHSHPAWSRYLELGRVFTDRPGTGGDDESLQIPGLHGRTPPERDCEAPHGVFRKVCLLKRGIWFISVPPTRSSPNPPTGWPQASGLSQSTETVGLTSGGNGLTLNVPGNRVTFVPKTALVDRVIAIEPRMNIFAQLGLGALMRSRLKRAGLDLDDQGPNQVLAHKGSVDGTVATIDLSMASDTIARELVRELIPEPWYNAMDWVRSKTGRLVENGIETTVRYEKFSSMGNGYTFELESLIFWALALGVCEHLNLSHEKKALVRAFGDDITVPVEAVELLRESLTFCGFRMNPEKSFSSGVFRESCGADFFNGVNVRPYFQKEFCNDVQGLYRLANGIRRVAYRRNAGCGCDRKLRPVWVHIIQRIPDSLRDLKIPFHAVSVPRGAVWRDVESGDGGLAVNHDEALSSRWVSFNRDYQRGWTFAQLQAGSVRENAESEGLLHLFALYSCRNGVGDLVKQTDSLITQRGKSRLQLNSGAYCPSWIDLGPWV